MVKQLSELSFIEPQRQILFVVKELKVILLLKNTFAYVGINFLLL